MANEHNLKPMNTKNKEERKKIGAMGGKASGEAKRRKKSLKEELEALLELMEDGKTNQELASISLLNEVKKGNVKAYEVMRDTIGQKPKEIVEQTNTDIVYDMSKMTDKEIKKLLDE